MTAIVTHHARERGRERLGLSATALQRMAEIVLREGFHFTELTGALRHYCNHLLREHRGKATAIVIHGEQLYAFAEAVLITVWPIPNRFKGQLAKFRRQRALSLP